MPTIGPRGRRRTEGRQRPEARQAKNQRILPILTSAFSRSGKQSWTILVPKSRYERSGQNVTATIKTAFYAELRFKDCRLWPM